MSDQYWLSEAQLERIKPYFPRSHGRPRVDDRRVISGIVHVIRNGLRWRDAPEVYGPHKTPYNHFMRWSRIGVFCRIFESLVGEGPKPERLMIDATHLKAHRTAASLAEKGGTPRRIGRTQGGLNSKLHAVTDGEGRPIMLMLSEGQMSDHTGAKLLYPHLPAAETLIADKGYDSDEFRDGLAAKGITPCIPSRSNRIADIILRQWPVQDAREDRDHVRQAKGLAPHCYALRPCRPHVLLGDMCCGYRHLLAPINES